jgi:hypothetical protein
MLKDSVSLFKNDIKPSEYERIFSIGSVDLETKEENYLCDLSNITKKIYLFFINGEKIEKDENLMYKIEEQIKQNSGIFVLWDVFRSDYEQDYVYILNYSDRVQID